MSQITDWLAGGDLRSDGLADEAVDFVLKNPELFDELWIGLKDSDDLILGRTADALEKVARKRPDLLVGHADELIRIAEHDRVPMVRWHLAMIFGHFAFFEKLLGSITPLLLSLLDDESAFVKSWSIVSLCIIGRKYPNLNKQITKQISQLQNDDSVAIRSKVSKALTILTDDTAPFPKGWIKSAHLKDL